MNEDNKPNWGQFVPSWERPLLELLTHSSIQAFKHSSIQAFLKNGVMLWIWLREYQSSVTQPAMQTFALCTAVFTSEPFQKLPDRKVADVVEEDSGLVRLTYLHPAIKSPQIYQSMDELKQIYCGDGSKFRLVFQS